MKNVTDTQKKLLAYAAMAAVLPAAKVTGQIIYHDLDPDISAYGEISCTDCHELEYLDLDMDGEDDFILGLYYDYGYGGYAPTRSAYLTPLGSNKVAYHFASQSVYFSIDSTYVLVTDTVAEKLGFGTAVNDTYDFTTLSAVLTRHYQGYDEEPSFYFGAWGYFDTAYAAIQLMIDGLPHYGWIRIGHGWIDYDIAVTAFEYAYNAIPGDILYAGVIPYYPWGPPAVSHHHLPASTLKQIPDTEGGLRMYPMPASQQLHMDWTEQISELRLFSADGRLVLTEYPETDRFILDVSGLEAGVYLMQVSGQKTMEWQQVVVD